MSRKLKIGVQSIKVSLLTPMLRLPVSSSSSGPRSLFSQQNGLPIQRGAQSVRFPSGRQSLPAHNCLCFGRPFAAPHTHCAGERLPDVGRKTTPRRRRPQRACWPPEKDAKVGANEWAKRSSREEKRRRRRKRATEAPVSVY